MLELNSDNFKKEVLDSPVPVLVDFWAPWCGPCKMMGPIVDELAAEMDSAKGKIAKVNVDDNSELSAEYGVLSIPTFIVFKGGQEVTRESGPQAKEKLLEMLRE